MPMSACPAPRERDLPGAGSLSLLTGGAAPLGAGGDPSRLSAWEPACLGMLWKGKRAAGQPRDSLGKEEAMDNKWWTLTAVCAGTFMLLLDVTIVVVALPEIQTSLHASFADVQWVIDAYALTLASLLLTTGVLADRYGRRKLFSIGLAVFTLGSLTCGLAQSAPMLIISRSAQGVGGAIVFATSLALLAESFRGKDRGVAFGIWGAITGVAVSLGPILGGAITTGLNWRGIFLVNIPVGVAALAVTLSKVPESRSAHPGQPDWAGFALLTTGLVGFVYGLIRASETSWGNE